jgi:all-trans-retinol 13,14-reductase
VTIANQSKHIAHDNSNPHTRLRRPNSAREINPAADAGPRATCMLQSDDAPGDVLCRTPRRDTDNRVGYRCDKAALRGRRVTGMTATGVSYKQHAIEDDWDAIVIGSGMGGQTAAALLARHGGKKVLVLERHSVAGGFTHVFHRSDYEWDVGVHYIGHVGDPRLDVRAAFDHLSEGRLRWNMMPDVYDRIRIGDRSYDFPAGTGRFSQQMKSYFPARGRDIDRYLHAVLAAARLSGLYFVEKAVPRPVATLLGGALRYGFMRYAGRTTAEVLARCTEDMELAAVLTGQWGNYGLPPAQSSFGIHSRIVHHYLEGAGYPAGGASSIAAAIAPTIERPGGKIVVGARVAGILVDRNRGAVGVRLEDGRQFRAGTIISDAGAAKTLTQLVPAEIARSLPEAEQVKRLALSTAHLSLYVGLRKEATAPEYGTANLWIYRDAQHDRNFARFCEDINQPFPAVYISFPSAKDPSFQERYPGRATIEVITFAPYRYFERWAGSRWHHRGAEYEALKQTLATRLLAELERCVPAVRGNIDYWELSTPLSTRHFTDHEGGAIYGLAQTPERFRARWLGARTPIPNLLLTGQDVAICGVTGAMVGGVIAASLALKRNMMAVVRRGNV